MRTKVKSMKSDKRRFKKSAERTKVINTKPIKHDRGGVRL